jgi:hypothetical protein
MLSLAVLTFQVIAITDNQNADLKTSLNLSNLNLPVKMAKDPS